jgi:hypothetical protein
MRHQQFSGNLVTVRMRHQQLLTLPSNVMAFHLKEFFLIRSFLTGTAVYYVGMPAS